MNDQQAIRTSDLSDNTLDMISKPLTKEEFLNGGIQQANRLLDEAEYIMMWWFR